MAEKAGKQQRDSSGRFATEAAEKRNVALPIRFSEKEISEVDDQSSSAGLGRSDYCRKRILGHRVTSKIDARLIRLLSKLGGLMKHTHNITDGRFDKQTGEVLRLIQQAIKAIDSDLPLSVIEQDAAQVASEIGADWTDDALDALERFRAEKRAAS
jgi:hypothetical protein